MTRPPAPRPRFSHRLVVRYADTDAQGHVYFANYLTYCDEALTGYFHAIGLPPKELVSRDGVDLVYARTEVRYRGSSYVEDRLDIHARISRLGRTSFTSEAVIHRAAAPDLLATATLVSVCVDPATHRPAPVPERLRALVHAYEGPGAVEDVLHGETGY
ncbi:MAG TPA: thioesterase family protein [Polyangiaceae bacterium LLY-WYZ-14_1]|nr:thioesterase family protein [Polyangiaceae bacterium LLY-WYZ-14_1]